MLYSSFDDLVSYLLFIYDVSVIYILQVVLPNKFTQGRGKTHEPKSTTTKTTITTVKEAIDDFKLDHPSLIKDRLSEETFDPFHQIGCG